MKRLKILLLSLLIVMMPAAGLAQTILAIYSTHATDCTSTMGKPASRCYEQDSQTLWQCVPASSDNICNTVGEWFQIKDPTATGPWTDGGSYLYPTNGESVLVGKTTSVGGTGNLELADTTAAVGKVYLGSNLFLHAFGTDNLFIGETAGNLTLTNAQENTALGKNALQSITTGDQDTAIGAYAMPEVTSGSGHTCVGNACMLNEVDGSSSTCVGFACLQNATRSDENTCVGETCLFSVTTAFGNSAFGDDAGFATTGDENTYVGHNSGFKVTTGTRNVYVGASAAGGINNATGADNVGIGYQAMERATSAAQNVAIGTDAMEDASSASHNVAIGETPGANLTTGGYNVLIGSRPGFTMTDGERNVYIGEDAGFSTTDGGYNVCIGSGSCYALTDGEDNVFIGQTSGNGNTSGSNNVAIGNAAGGGSTMTGDNNVYLGNAAGDNTTSGAQNIAIGDAAGLNFGSAFDNICIGTDSCVSDGGNPITGMWNVIIGSEAAHELTSGTQNIGIGELALNLLTTGLSNVAIGTMALDNVTTAGTNIAIGREAGSRITSGTPNIAIGYQAIGGAGTGMTGSLNTCVGYQCMKLAAGANNNVGVGDLVMDAVTTAADNTGIGVSALGALTDGEQNIGIGTDALLSITTADFNTCVGDSACRLATTSENTALGENALATTTTGTGQNTSIGAQSGGITTGWGNTFLGYSSGNGPNTGKKNICLGYDTCNGAADFSNSIAIGAGIDPTANNQIIFGTSAHTTTVAGTLLITNNFGDAGGECGEGEGLVMTSGLAECTPAGGGSGDITAVGDVASGAAFDGTQGTTLTFNDADGDKTIQYENGAGTFYINDSVNVAGTMTVTSTTLIGLTTVSGTQPALLEVKGNDTSTELTRRLLNVEHEFTPTGDSNGSSVSSGWFTARTIGAKDIGTVASLTGAVDVYTLTGGEVDLVEGIDSDLNTFYGGNIGHSMNFSGNTFHGGTGTITDARGFESLVDVGGGGTITNYAGFYVNSAGTSSGTITNNYGLYIASQTNGGSDYAIFTNAGTIHFGDGVEIDNQKELRLYEADGNGNNYFSIKDVASRTSNASITLENDSNPIPDSAVGNGSDGQATSFNLPIYSAKITGGFVVFTPPSADACTQGAQIDAGDGNWRLLFDATTDECATWQFVIPNNYASGPILKISYTMTSGTTNEVELEAAIMCVGSNTGVDINTASFSNVATVSETVDGTVGDMHTVTITLNDDSCAAGQTAFVVLSFDSNDATNDDATGDREIVGSEFQYTGI